MTHIPTPCTEPQTLHPHYTSSLVAPQLPFTPAATPSLSRNPKHTPQRSLTPNRSPSPTADPHPPGLLPTPIFPTPAPRHPSSSPPQPRMTRPLPQLPLSLPFRPSAPPPTPTPAPAGPLQAFHLVHELPALLHHLLVHGPRRVGAEVVVVVVVRLEGVLHEPDQAARARTPGAAAAPGPRALFHIAGHSPGRVRGPAASAGSAWLRVRERRRA